MILYIEFSTRNRIDEVTNEEFVKREKQFINESLKRKIAEEIFKKMTIEEMDVEKPDIMKARKQFMCSVCIVPRNDLEEIMKILDSNLIEIDRIKDLLINGAQAIEEEE